MSKAAAAATSTNCAKFYPAGRHQLKYHVLTPNIDQVVHHKYRLIHDNGVTEASALQYYYKMPGTDISYTLTLKT